MSDVVYTSGPPVDSDFFPDVIDAEAPQTLVAGYVPVPGPQGPSGTIEVVSVEKLDVDADPEVENIGTPQHARFIFRWPAGVSGDTGPQGDRGPVGIRGPQGLPGAAATINLLESVTLPAGQAGFVTNHGDSHDTILQFALPQGVQGPTGPGFLPGGAWSPATAYEPNFIVTNAGSVYRRKDSGISGATFAADAAHWELWAAKGDTGIQGVQGVKGDTGVLWRGNWVASTAYALNDTVAAIRPGRSGRSTLVCINAHTSGTAYNATEDAFWNVAADSGEPPVQPVTATITSVLNIVSATSTVGGNRFALQYAPTPPNADLTASPNPIVQNTTQAVVTAAQNTMIAASYVPPAEATVTADGRRVDLRVRIDAATTSGSLYPRTEFRENGLTGAQNAFDPAVGTHWIRGRFRFTHLPLQNGGIKPEVVICQLHNNNNDVIALRTQVSTNPTDGSRQLRLVLRVNGTAAGVVTFAAPPQIGTEYDFMIRLVEGTAFVHFANVNNPDGFAQPVWTSDPFQPTGDTKGTQALGYSWGFTSGSTSTGGAGTTTPGWYFKFGLYAQTNALIEQTQPGASAPYNVPQQRMYSVTPGDTITGNRSMATDYFSAEFSRIQHWHTGWPQPQYVDYGYAVAGPQGIAGAAASIDGVSATQLPEGSAPTVVNTGTGGNAALVFGIPKGATGATGQKGDQGLQGYKGDTGSTGAQGVKGDTGDAATIAVGSTTTGAAGSTAAVTNSGSSAHAYLDFVVPRGDKGDKGDTGAQGIQGQTGPQGIQGPQGTQGVQGPIGQTGPQGAAGTVFRGAWLVGSSYATGDLVTWGGSGYIAGAPTPAVGTPPTGTSGNAGTDDTATNTGWTLFVMQGAQGDQGPQGIQGIQGQTGPQGIQGPQGVQGQTGGTGSTGPVGPAAATKVDVTGLALGTQAASQTAYTYYPVAAFGSGRYMVTGFSLTADTGGTYDVVLRGGPSDAATLFASAVNVQRFYSFDLMFYAEVDSGASSLYVGIKNRDVASHTFTLTRLRGEKMS